jgi:hypothetical protein
MPQLVAGSGRVVDGATSGAQLSASPPRITPCGLVWATTFTARLLAGQSTRGCQLAQSGVTADSLLFMETTVPSASTRERWMRTPAMRSPVVVSGVFGRQTSRPVMNVAAGASTLRVTTPEVSDMHDGALCSKS